MKRLFLSFLLAISALVFGACSDVKADESTSVSKYGIEGLYNATYNESTIEFTPYNEMGTQGAYIEHNIDFFKPLEGEYSIVGNKLTTKRQMKTSVSEREYLIFGDYLCMSMIYYSDFPEGESVSYQYSNNKIYLEYKEDGSYVYKSFDGKTNDSGSYVIDGNVVTVTLDNGRVDKYYNDGGDIYGIAYQKAE